MLKHGLLGPGPKNREICQILAFDFLNCESTCDLTTVPASVYVRKTTARRFDTFNEIFRLLVSRNNFLLFGLNAAISRQRERMHMRLSGTDGLT